VFHGISWVLQGSFKGISKKFLGVFQEGLSQFQGRLKGVSSLFEECFTGGFKVVPWVF